MPGGELAGTRGKVKKWLETLDGWCCSTLYLRTQPTYGQIGSSPAAFIRRSLLERIVRQERTLEVMKHYALCKAVFAAAEPEDARAKTEFGEQWKEYLSIAFPFDKTIRGMKADAMRKVMDKMAKEEGPMMVWPLPKRKKHSADLVMPKMRKRKNRR